MILEIGDLDPGHNLPDVSLCVALGHSASHFTQQPFLVRKEVGRNLPTAKADELN